MMPAKLLVAKSAISPNPDRSLYILAFLLWPGISQTRLLIGPSKYTPKRTAAPTRLSKTVSFGTNTEGPEIKVCNVPKVGSNS
jgi:hypothetical protein